MLTRAHHRQGDRVAGFIGQRATIDDDAAGFDALAGLAHWRIRPA